MRWRPPARAAVLLGVVAGALGARGQERESTPGESQPADELPAAVRAALDEIQDFTFNFDQPGFYAVVGQVKRNPHAPGFAQPPEFVSDWRALLERPHDFRGRVITLEGLVGRNKTGYGLARAPDLGTIWQLELSHADQPLTCTAILTQDAADVPVGATIRLTGYFVMIRQYHGASQAVHQAALLVGVGPDAILRRGVPPSEAGPETSWLWILAAVAAGLLITFWLLRRAASAKRTGAAALRASRPAPTSLADDLAAWSGGPPEDKADTQPPERDVS